MAVRAPTWLTDALRWRWTPTIALILGSLLYVICAMLFVPSDIRFSGPAPSAQPRSVQVGAPTAGNDVDAAEPDAADDGTTRRSKRQRRRAATETAEAAPMPAPEEEPLPRREEGP